MLKLNDNFLFTLDSIGGTQGYLIKPISALKFIDNLKFGLNQWIMLWICIIIVKFYYNLHSSLLKTTDINSTIEERKRQKTYF